MSLVQQRGQIDH